MNSKKILLLIFTLFVIFGAWYFYNKKNNGEWIACTLEAKLCPDGSYVGRSGPKCEFSPCPEIPAHQGWNTYEASGISFQYPDELVTKYIGLQDWPPQVRVVEGPYSCTDAGSSIERAGRSETKVINGHTYCVTQVTEAAAGSTYNQYAYGKIWADKTVIFTFTTREPQCMNYDEPKRTECLEERQQFSIDDFMDGVISTLKISK